MTCSPLVSVVSYRGGGGGAGRATEGAAGGASCSPQLQGNYGSRYRVTLAAGTV